MNSTERAPRSTFVSVVAWVFIGLGAMSTLVGLLQSLVFVFLVPDLGAALEAEQAKQTQEIPPIAIFMAKYFKFVIVGTTLIAIAMLISAIGLLKRHNWARVAYIFYFALTIFWNVAALPLQYFWLDSMFSAVDIPAEEMAVFDVFSNIMMVIGVVMALLFSALFGWLIWKFRSPAVKAEFGVV